jgi:hypothetical protein
MINVDTLFKLVEKKIILNIFLFVDILLIKKYLKYLKFCLNQAFLPKIS